jgi:hypothetical protein
VVVAAVDRLIDAGAVRDGEDVVALLCGSGHRETFLSRAQRPATAIRCDLPGLADLLGRLALP